MSDDKLDKLELNAGLVLVGFTDSDSTACFLGELVSRFATFFLFAISSSCDSEISSDLISNFADLFDFLDFVDVV